MVFGLQRDQNEYRNIRTQEEKKIVDILKTLGIQMTIKAERIRRMEIYHREGMGRRFKETFKMGGENS